MAMPKTNLFERGTSTLIDHSVADQVFERLRGDIFNGKFQPGEPLKELVLARAFAVSQSSVRAALQRLTEQGLVERRPRRGTCITSFTPEEMAERTKVRILLESFAAVEAKRRMDADSLSLLRKKAAAADSAVKLRRARTEITELDFDFHRTLWQVAGNRTLERILEHLSAPLFAYLLLKTFPYGDRYLDRINPHFPIVESLEKGSEDEVEEAIRTHITRGGIPFPDPSDGADL